MFTGIHGQWRIPKVIPLSSQMDNPGDGIISSSSTWIGLDGARSYLHSSLPQIGTTQKIVATNGKLEAQYEAWWEWWCAGYITQGAVLGLKVTAGDLIMCALTVVSPTRVIFDIKNDTTGDIHPSFAVDAPSLPLPGTVSTQVAEVRSGELSKSIQRHITGSTAEWIVERPSDPKRDKPYILANYGEVLFENCVATAALGPNGPNGVDQLLQGAILRDLVEIRNNRTVPISVARLLNNQSVGTYYQEP